VSDPGAFREIARSVRIEYPIPYVSVVLGALALACFGLTALIPSAAAWAAGGVRVLSGLAAIGLPVYAAIRRPDLLRSERHNVVSRAMDLLLDKELAQDTRYQMGRIVEGVLGGDDIPRRQLGRKPGGDTAQDGADVSK
jgi:hypothetical protein